MEELIQPIDLKLSKAIYEILEQQAFYRELFYKTLREDAIAMSKMDKYVRL